MSLSAIVEALFEAGASKELILAAVRAHECAVDGGRSARQERNRRHYENKKAERLKASEKRLKTSESDASEKRLKASETVLNSDALRVRVKDITSTSVDKPNLTTLNGELVSDNDAEDIAWPDDWPPSRDFLDRLEAVLRKTAGPALNAASPNLLIVAPIVKLAKAGAGPRCEIHLDVLPVIRARSARAPPGSVASWDYFTAAILEARDRRLSGAPATRPVTHDRPDQTAKRAQRDAANAADFAGAKLAAELRGKRREGGF